jgi:hypothetical protein
MNTRYAVFAYNYGTRQYNEIIYDNYLECEVALESFTEFGIQAFICVSDECMDGKIAEVLFREGACFNA